MNDSQYSTLKSLLESKMWEAALATVESLLPSHPLAVQLHLLRGQLIQLQDENTSYPLDEVEKSLQRAVELEATYFDALVELMHFYDAVCPDMPKAITYAKQVKTIAQQALDEASAILAEAVESSA